MYDIFMEQYRDEMVRDLVNFLKIKSVKTAAEPNIPYGKGIFDALMYICNITDKMDFECVNMYGHLAYIDYGTGDQTMGILTHIDVVPAGEGWTHDAFGGEIVDGRIYGRGAMDDKGPAIAALYALKALSDNMIHLKKKVRLIFGCDEESGWSDMDFYKAHEKLPDLSFSPDGDYPIINAEKGLIHMKLSAKLAPSAAEGMKVLRFTSGTRVNVVPNKAECLLRADFNAIQEALRGYKDPAGAALEAQNTPEGVLIKAAGTGSHGSRPNDGVNAASALMLFIHTLPLAPGPFADCVRTAAELLGHACYGQHCGLQLEDAASGQLTISMDVVNADEGSFEMLVDIRYPISYKEDFIMGIVRERLGSVFQVEIMHAVGPHYMDENSELIRKLKEVYEEIMGEKAYCMSTGGATYARAFPNAVTFGPKFPNMPSLEHGPDEYIDIDALVLNSQIIVNALIKICGKVTG